MLGERALAAFIVKGNGSCCLRAFALIHPLLYGARCLLPLLKNLTVTDFHCFSSLRLVLFAVDGLLDVESQP